MTFAFSHFKGGQLCQSTEISSNVLVRFPAAKEASKIWPPDKTSQSTDQRLSTAQDQNQASLQFIDLCLIQTRRCLGADRNRVCDPHLTVLERFTSAEQS